LAHDRYAIWNGPFPTVLLVNETLLEILRSLPASASRVNGRHLRELTKARIVCTESTDYSDRDFFSSAERKLRELDAAAGRFYRRREAYKTLEITVDVCNLGCPYCLRKEATAARARTRPAAEHGPRRLEVIRQVLDEFLRRAVSNGLPRVALSLNGGEILLKWSIIEDLLEYARKKYPALPVHCVMNTNATLLTKTLARRLKDLGVVVNVSIDGYAEMHDKTRRFLSGRKASFDRVIEGIRAYNADRDPSTRIRSFQGTIESPGEFDMAKFLGMCAYGFESARLAPNLLRKTGEEGRVAAEWEAALVTRCDADGVAASGSRFQQTCAEIGKRQTGYSHRCNGLRGIAAGSLTLNIDSMEASLLCSFIPDSVIAIADLGHDIFSPRLWEAARASIVTRLASLRKNCAQCEVLGVCQGGCVINGLDVTHQVNPAACEYQRTLWRRSVEFSFADTLVRHAC
jgi:radical SAM protein with 4Fe4S-binding SPASM domain